MELVIAIISLMWVIGILSLQRLDSIIDEYAKALAYYLSTEDGVINQTQLQVKSLLPKTAIVILASQISTIDNRKDKAALKGMVAFFDVARRTKSSFEALLIISTLLLPMIFAINFSRLSYVTFMNKNVLLYIFLFAIVISAFTSEKYLSRLAKRSYPISIRFTSQK